MNLLPSWMKVVMNRVAEQQRMLKAHLIYPMIGQNFVEWILYLSVSQRI